MIALPVNFGTVNPSMLENYAARLSELTDR